MTKKSYGHVCSPSWFCRISADFSKNLIPFVSSELKVGNSYNNLLTYCNILSDLLSIYFRQIKCLGEKHSNLEILKYVILVFRIVLILMINFKYHSKSRKYCETNEVYRCSRQGREKCNFIFSLFLLLSRFANDSLLVKTPF